MHVQRVQISNTSFGASLKINNNYYRKIEKPVIDFLEGQFPKKTENIEGSLELTINGDTAYSYLSDTLKYNNGKGYKDSIEIDFDVSENELTILDKLVKSLKGFLIREEATNKMEALKDEIINISDKAYHDSAKEFRKSFRVYERSLSTKDIDSKDSPLWISIYRNS